MVRGVVTAGVQQGGQWRKATPPVGCERGGGVPDMPPTPLQEYPTPIPKYNMCVFVHKKIRAGFA